MTLKNLTNVKREYLPDKITQSLSHAIMTGGLPPGTRLMETDLAAQLGVSRIPLREAIRTLKSQGLVEARRNRGTYVVEVSADDVDEIYSLRSLLEVYAVGRVAERATSEQVGQLQALVDRMMEAARAGNDRQAVELDLQFHATIWKMSGHRRLFQILSEAKSQIHMFLTVNAQLYKDLVDSVSDHRRIVDAIQSRQADPAMQIMGDHIAGAAQMVRDFVNRKESAHPVE